MSEYQPEVVSEDVVEGSYVHVGNTPKVAGDNLQNDADTVTDAANAAAASAGVHHPSYLNYETALNAYGNRADVESLVARRRREAASDMGDQQFVRTTADDEPAQS